MKMTAIKKYNIRLEIQKNEKDVVYV